MRSILLSDHSEFIELTKRFEVRLFRPFRIHYISSASDNMRSNLQQIIPIIRNLLNQLCVLQYA